MSCKTFKLTSSVVVCAIVLVAVNFAHGQRGRPYRPPSRPVEPYRPSERFGSERFGSERPSSESYKPEPSPKKAARDITVHDLLPNLAFRNEAERQEHELEQASERQAKLEFGKLNVDLGCKAYATNRRPDRALFDRPITSAKELGVVSFMPTTDAAFSNVFSKSGDGGVKPTAAQLNESKLAAAQLASLRAHNLGDGSGGETLQRTLVKMKESGVRLVLVVGHTPDPARVDELNLRRVRMTDGSTMTIQEIHNLAMDHQMAALVFTCYSPDLNLSRQLAFREAIDCCHYAIEPLLTGEPHAVEARELSATSATSPAVSITPQEIIKRCGESMNRTGAASVGISVSFIAAFLETLSDGASSSNGNGSTPSNSVNTIIVTTLARRTWRFWLAGASAALSYMTLWWILRSLRPSMRPRTMTPEALAGYVRERLDLMTKRRAQLVLMVLTAVAGAIWGGEWIYDSTEGVDTGTFSGVRGLTYLALVQSMLAWGMVWRRPESSIWASMVHGFSGALVYPLISMTRDFRWLSLATIGAGLIAILTDGTFLLYISWYGIGALLIVALFKMLEGFGRAATGRSLFCSAY